MAVRGGIRKRKRVGMPRGLMGSGVRSVKPSQKPSQIEEKGGVAHGAGKRPDREKKLLGDGVTNIEDLNVRYIRR